MAGKGLNMATTQYGPFPVFAGDVATGLNVLPGDTVQTIATGVVSFAHVTGRTFSADGNDWATPNDYPAPELRMHSLIARFGAGPWHQGGTTAQIPVPIGKSGEMVLRTNDHDDWLWDNDGQWSVTLIHTRPDPLPPGQTPPMPSLSVAGVELVQSIQTWNNTVPLILGKRTLVRVYVDSGIRTGGDIGWGPNGWGGVTGTVTVTNPLDGSTVATLFPTHGQASIVARPLAEIDREQLAHSLNFELPPAAIALPQVDIEVSVGVPSTSWQAVQSTRRSFLARSTQPVLPILINLETNKVGPPSIGQFMSALIEHALPRLPVAETGFLVHPTFGWTTTQDLTNEADWRGLLEQISTVALISSTRVDGIRCAVVDDGMWAFNGIGSAAIWGSNRPTFIANVTRLTTFAHEMTHTFGVGHSNCAGTEQNLDPRKIPGKIDEIGFDFANGTIVPRGNIELMGYCGQDRWPSVKTYEILADQGVI